jgi:type I restriction enzyme M protein
VVPGTFPLLDALASRCAQCIPRNQPIGDILVTINELLANSKSQFSLDVFSERSKAAVEADITEKGGKYYLKCLARGKDVVAKPEEIIRQLWLHRLQYDFKYPLSRLTVEYPITFGRDSSKRADIVVFDPDRPTVPYIIVEVKQPTEKGGKDQLKSYCHATGAPLALWSDGLRQVVWHRKNPNYFVVIPELPTANQTIEDIAGQPWTIETLIEKERQREAEGIKARSLRQIIEDLG